MTAIAVLMILTVAVLLGLYLGLLYLRGDGKPVLSVVHLLFGIGGLGTLLMLLYRPIEGTEVPAGSLGEIAAVCLVVAAITGLSAVRLRRFRSVANIMLAGHSGAASVGFMLLLYWVSSP